MQEIVVDMHHQYSNKLYIGIYLMYVYPSILLQISHHQEKQ